MWIELGVGFLCGALVVMLFYQRQRISTASKSERGLPLHSQEALSVLQTFYEHAPTLLGVMELGDCDLKHIFDNPAACRFFGAAPGATQGKLDSELGVPQAQTAEWRRMFEQSLQQRTPLRFQFKATDARWFTITACPLIEPTPGKQQFCYLAEDISDWRNNAEQARLDRERLQIALEGGGLGFWDWDLQTSQVRYGGAWLNIVGITAESLSPDLSSWSALVHPDDLSRVMSILRSNLDGQSPEYDTEYRLRRQSGDWVWVSARGRVVEWNHAHKATRHIGIVEDIHERREVREQLAAAAYQKDEFLATLAHELRNPLAPIRTGLAILREDPNCQAALQARDMMERQLLHLVRLIDDLLDISRISLGRLELKKARTSVKQIIDTAVEGSRSIIEANNHTLIQDVPQEPIYLSGDLTRLAQVVSNLLNNAAKYTPKGGKIQIRVERYHRTIAIKVVDTGLGIPMGMLERVFDMFGQINRSIERSQGGLGIGLALVKQLVDLHNGTVYAESAGEGQGSTFTVTLPIESESASPPMEPHHEAHLNVPIPKKILIVDDNIDGAESLSLFLKMKGHFIRVAHGALTALEIFNVFLPDVVFLDIGLPEMDGYQVAKLIRLRSGGPEACIVAITGWGSDKDRYRARQAGFNAHLTKPVDLEAVQKLAESGTGTLVFK